MDTTIAETTVEETSADTLSWKWEEPWKRNYGALSARPLDIAAVPRPGGKYDLVAITAASCIVAKNLTGTIAPKWQAIDELGGKLTAMTAVAGEENALDVFVAMEAPAPAKGHIIHGEVDDGRYTKLTLPGFVPTQLAACVSGPDRIDLYATGSERQVAVRTITATSKGEWARVKLPLQLTTRISAASANPGERLLASAGREYFRLLRSFNGKDFDVAVTLTLPFQAVTIAQVSSPAEKVVHLVVADRDARTASIEFEAKIPRWTVGSHGTSKLEGPATVASLDREALEFIAVNHVGNICPRACTNK